MTETVTQLEKTTGELMDILRSKPDAAAFVQENADELQNKTVPELLADLLERKQLTRAAVPGNKPKPDGRHPDICIFSDIPHKIFRVSCS